MKRIILCLFLMLISTKCFAQENVVVVLGSERCVASKIISKVFKSPKILERTKQNNQAIYVVNGPKNWDLVKRHKIRWFPTVIKVEKNKKGSWVERERIVGGKKLEFMLDFLGVNGIMIVEKKRKQSAPIMNIGGT